MSDEEMKSELERLRSENASADIRAFISANESQLKAKD
jgi:hypothetical protein